MRQNAAERLAMHQGPRGLRPAQRPCEHNHGKRQERRAEQKQNQKWPPDGENSRASQQRAAKRTKSVSDRIQPRHELQPIREDANREKHAARHAGNAEEEPLCGISALEKQKMARRENSEPGKSKKSGDEHGRDSGPVCATKLKSKEHCTPCNVNCYAQCCRDEGIGSRAGQHHGQRSLSDKQMFERARVPRFLETAVKSIDGGVEIIQKNETDQREGKVTFVLREGVLKLGAVYEARHIEKHGNAEQRLDSIKQKNSAVGACDGKVAPEEKPQLAKRPDHSVELSSAKCGLCPVSRRKASSRDAAPVRFFKRGTESQASSRPASMMATRSASSSISESAWEAKSSVVSPRRRISDFRKRRNSAAPIASRLRVGSSNKSTRG